MIIHSLHDEAMLCHRCEYRLARYGRLRDSFAERWELGQWRLLSRIVCAACGGMLPAADATTIMLDKMSQLAAFGLGGADRTLLRARRRQVAEEPT